MVHHRIIIVVIAVAIALFEAILLTLFTLTKVIVLIASTIPFKFFLNHIISAILHHLKRFITIF